MVAGRRTGRGLREVPGLAPRLAAALGRRRRPRRPAGDPVARGGRRPRPPRAAHPRLPRPFRRRRRQARRPAVAAVRLRHPQRLARRAAGDRHPGARRHAALLPAHAQPRLLGRPADAGRTPARGRGSVRRRCRRQPAAARLGRGRPRLHGAAGQLRSGASQRRDRRLRRPAPNSANAGAAAAPAGATCSTAAPRPRAPLRAAVDLDDPSLQVPRLPHPAARTAGAARPAARPARRPALRPAAAAARHRGAGAGHRPVRAVPRGGVRRPAGQRRPIPYALADASPLADEPLADLFLRLLALPVSRFGLEEILDLLATPAAGRRQRPGRRRLRAPARLAAARPARAGASMPPTARARARRPTMPTPGSSRWTGCCSAMPAAPTTTSPASRRGASWKAARWTRWTGCCGCCACWRAMRARWARRCRRRSGASAC